MTITPSDPIQALDIAVVDQDLLWRVEMMNALRPRYAGEFADVVAMQDWVHPHHHTIVLLGRSLTESTLDELQAFRAEHPHVVAVAIAGERVAEGAPGVDEVLPATVDDVEVVQRLWELVSARDVEPAVVEIDEGITVPVTELAKLARTIVVTAAKAGEGATTVAANLAVALAQHVGPRVALVETDPGFGDLALAFGLQAPGAGSALDRRNLIDEDLLDRCTFPVADLPLDVVLLPQGLDPFAPVDTEVLVPLLGALSRRHAWLVMDIAAPLLARSALTEVADLVLVTTSPRLQSVKNASRLHGAMQWSVLADKHLVELVVCDHGGHEHDPAAVAHATGMPLAATIPHDRNAASSVEHHEPLVLSHPHSPAARAFRSLAEQVFRLVGVAEAERP